MRIMIDGEPHKTLVQKVCWVRFAQTWKSVEGSVPRAAGGRARQGYISIEGSQSSRKVMTPPSDAAHAPMLRGTRKGGR